ncbi:MAG: signal peptide peptidase SppA [Planctomycetota bacterium]|jgi:protease-4
MGKKKMYFMAVLLFLAFAGSGCGPSAYLIQRVPGGRKLKETQIERDKGLFVTDKIVVIDVDGLMANTTRDRFLRRRGNQVSLFVEKLDKARKDPAVKAVVLRLNSPGGTVAATDMMYHKLRQFKSKSSKPVVACMLDVAASGAYFLACGCDGIVGLPSTVTGSIGTIVQTISFAGTMRMLGVKSVAIKSGRLKDLGSPLHDLSEEEREVLSGIITQFYEQFVEVVDEGRPGLSEEQVRELADGRVFTAEQALAEGLIDRIGYPSDAVAWAKELARVKRAQVVIYHRPAGYKPNIYSAQTYNPAAVGALVNLELPDWLTSHGTQFLYLWQPGLQ